MKVLINLNNSLLLLQCKLRIGVLGGYIAFWVQISLQFFHVLKQEFFQSTSQLGGFFRSDVDKNF